MVRAIVLPGWYNPPNRKNRKPSSGNPGSSGKATADRSKSERYTLALLDQLAALAVPPAEREHRFRSDRLWRFDLAWPSYAVACEIDGGTYTQGRHTRGDGYEDDCRKYNAAACLSWCVIRVTPKMINNGEAAIYVAETLRISGCAGIAAQAMPWENEG